MATKKKVVEAAVVEEPRKINYAVSRLKFNETTGKYERIVAGLIVPAHWKITFGPPVIKHQAGLQRDYNGERGSLLRLYDGKLQRGVLPNVLDFWATEEIEYSEMKIG